MVVKLTARFTFVDEMGDNTNPRCSPVWYVMRWSDLKFILKVR